MKTFLFALLLLPVFATSQNISNGLVQYYPFINGTKDESNHSPDAKVFESHYARDMHGYIEGCPSLIGNGYYIEFPDSVNLATPGWTYSVWFKLYALPAEVYESDAFLLTYKTTVTYDDVHLYVDDEDNRIKVYFKNGAYKVSTGIVVQKGRWYHVALRYSATSTDIFVDGNFAVSSSGRFSPMSGYSPLIVSSLVTYPVNKGRVFGDIDDIRMYKRTLTNAEINLIYTTEKNMVAPPVAKDTVYIRDTVKTVVHDTVYKNIVVLDTVILGGSCAIYPNPVNRSDRIYIQTNDRPVTVTIYNATGQLMRREQLTTQNYIVVNNLAAGTYYLKIVSPFEQCGKKLVIY